MATNTLTSERYIGFTSRPFKRRKGDHLKGSINGWSPGLFAEAICQYGAAAFEWQILGTFPTATEALTEEQRLIKVLRPEYNRTRGGGAYKPLVHTDKVVRKLRRLARKNIADWRSKYARLGPAAIAKTVVCLDDGKMFPSAKAAGRYYSLPSNAISDVCRKRKYRNTAGGHVFRHFGDHENAAEQIQKMRSASKDARLRAQDWKRISVRCVEDGRVFAGALEAARFYGMKDEARYLIGDVCRGKRRPNGKTARSVAGLRFRYVAKS